MLFLLVLRFYRVFIKSALIGKDSRCILKPKDCILNNLSPHAYVCPLLS